MKSEDISIEVAAKNGRDQRPVVARSGDFEFRDTLNTDSRISRQRFLIALAAKTGIDVAELEGLESRMIKAADDADTEADEAIEEHEAARKPRPEPQRAGPQVMLPGECSTITKTADQLGCLVAPSEHFYMRGGVPMRAAVVGGELELAPWKPAAACSDFETVAFLTKIRRTKESQEIVPAVCSEPTAKQILEAQSFRQHLPPITVLSRCPVLIERDAKLVAITGYDRISGIWAMGNTPPNMPLERARELLELVLADFQFAGPGDKARALAAIITPAMAFGGLLGGRAPMDVGEADDSQTGKGYRNKLTTAIYRNTPRIITQREGGVGSLQETFDAALVAGACFPTFDNLRGKLDLPGLESFMTESNYSARVPYSPTVVIDTAKTVVLVTTNKGEFTKDKANRASVTRILKHGPGFQYRKFPEGRILNHVQAHQEEFLAAVFAIIREWYRLGMPQLEQALHDFESWACKVGWIVQHLLGAGPMLDDHRQIQVRISTPAASWLRDVALAVKAADKLGVPLRTHHLLNVVLEAEIATAGIEQDLDMDSEEEFKKGTRALGRVLRRAMKEDKLWCDNIKIERCTTSDQGYRDVPEYLFTVDIPPTTAPLVRPKNAENAASPNTPESTPEENSTSPNPPNAQQTFKSSEKVGGAIESVAPIRGFGDCGNSFGGRSVFGASCVSPEDEGSAAQNSENGPSPPDEQEGDCTWKV